MQNIMKLSQLANIVSGACLNVNHPSQAIDKITFQNISIDTRRIQAGDLYVALKGENFDGHDFVAQARTQGAVAAIVSHEVPDALPQIVVADTRLALGTFAKWYRDQFSLPVLAVTGSNGKTTTKEMLASILSQCGSVLASQGNFNNDIGVPLTLLQLRNQHRFAVIEMGANAPGEIAYVASLASPQITVITNVAPAHLAGFGDIEGVAKEKGAIYQALNSDGAAIINADDRFASYWIAGLKGQRVIRFHCEKDIDPSLASITSGASEISDFYASNLSCNDESYFSFQLHCPLGETAITLPVPGKHMVANALAAAAAAYAAGAPLSAIKAGLEQVKPVKGRLCSRRGINGSRIIDDTYNANPASIKAAINVLVQSRGQGILVLGDMGEMGDDAVNYHRWVGEQAKMLGIKQFYACGKLSAMAVSAFGSGGTYFAEQSDLIQALRPKLSADNVVLVKGSRSSKMENVVNALIEG